MRSLLVNFFVLASVFAVPVWPIFGVPSDSAQIQSKADDGPYVLWEGDKAHAHWIKNGAHVVKTFNAPFDLPLEGFGSLGLRLDGRAYPEVEFELPEPPRIFVLSDVHGVFDVMRDLLVANKVIDSRNRWTFGKGHLVILGDVADRGDQVTEIYWFIRALEESARTVGGRVHMIMGNHEAMLLTGDYRYVNPMYMGQVDGMPSLAYLYGTQSEFGRWLRNRPLMLKLGSTLFLHGGISPEFLARGLDIAAANRNLRLAPKEDRDELNAFLQGSAGPLWYRGMVLDNQSDSITEADIDRTLARFNVKRVVVGHTTVEKASSLHNGKVLAIDAGIQHRRGEALYIQKGKIFRALPDGSKVEL
ncbi:MAG: metallophosphoesterase [Holophagales bacterium]|nr:metallophosphoesterase [Holophagales bacterium]